MDLYARNWSREIFCAAELEITSAPRIVPPGTLHSGKELRRVVMVGGGAQNMMLRRLTAEKTGAEVIPGPAKSSTIGNIAVQLAVLEAHLPTTSSEFRKAVKAWARQVGSAELLLS